MLIAHHIIDTLRSGKTPYQVLTYPDVSQDREFTEAAASLIEKAEKFDFGELVLEQVPEEKHPNSVMFPDGAIYRPPPLSEEERGFWAEGFIPLPAPLIWLEFSLGGSRTGLLVIEEGMEWACSRFDVVNGVLAYDGSRVCANRTESLVEGGLRVSMIAHDSVAMRAKEDTQYRHNNLAGMALVIYMVLMIHSRTTERIAAPEGPPKLNKKRASKGKSPLQAHTVVNIVPNSYRDAAEQGGTHASPRLHWRRSHLRRYEKQTTASKWSEQHQAWVAVIPRMLVGKAELGEVSHHYKVAT